MRQSTLYLFDFFERNKGEYYDALSFVRARNDLEQWIVFFLSAVIETAQKGKDTFEAISSLRSKYEKLIMGLGRKAQKAHRLILQLFSDPAVTIADISKGQKMSTSVANRLAKDLEQLGILKEITGFSRNRIFVLHEYLDLFKS